jgi:hypothetical protein
MAQNAMQLADMEHGHALTMLALLYRHVLQLTVSYNVINRNIPLPTLSQQRMPQDAWCVVQWHPN